jgi:gentisate 1,2-dioxygenase
MTQRLPIPALLWLMFTVHFAGLPASAAEPATIPHDLRFPDVMRIKRVVDGADGKSKLDVIELPIAAGETGVSLVSRLYATDVELGYGLPGTFIDWHRVTTPRLFMVLQGAWEFGTGDGKRHLLQAGDIVLAADTTGQGHTARNVGKVPSFVLTVRLPLQDPLKLKPNALPVK